MSYTKRRNHVIARRKAVARNGYASKQAAKGQDDLLVVSIGKEPHKGAIHQSQQRKDTRNKARYGCCAAQNLNVLSNKRRNHVERQHVHRLNQEAQRERFIPNFFLHVKQHTFVLQKNWAGFPAQLTSNVVGN